MYYSSTLMTCLVQYQTFTVYHILCLDSMFLPSTRIVTLSSFLFFGLGISCSVESTNALKPGKYSSSTSSMVLALLLERLYNFFGNGTHSFMSGSSIDISL